MVGYVLKLRGCTPEPLGNYLKGLGVFRLIAEQADPRARAWWQDGFLHILQSRWFESDSRGNEDRMTDWLLQGCHFTPLVAPWRKGTGYLPGGERKEGAEALRGLLCARHPGTKEFRKAFVDFARSRGMTLGCHPAHWLARMQQASTLVTDAELHRTLRNLVRSASTLSWLDAVGTVRASGNDRESPDWFRILANGGGEASGHYVINHQQRLQVALMGDQAVSRQRLKSSLFATNHPDSLEANSMGAMYYPSLMKAPNVGQDFLPDPQRRVNPWDFILLLEGSLVWSLAANRRQGVTKERSSFPFYCRSSLGGTTAIGPKEVEGAENSIANGELWCPIWSRPALLTELRRIFGEGRLQVGEHECSRSLEFAVAMKGFGIDRGIDAFYRYSLLERSGSGRQTTLLAIPCGCFVPSRSTSVSLLVELQRFAEDISATLVDSGQQQRRLLYARAEFERTWFAATTSASAKTSGGLGPLFEDVLVSAGRLMRELGTNTGKPGVAKVKRSGNIVEKRIPPVRSLSVGWNEVLGTCGDSASRIAHAIAGVSAWGRLSEGGRQDTAVDALRVNLFPMRRDGRYWSWDETSRAAVWSRGAGLDANLAAVLRRRLVDAQRGTGDGLPLWSDFGAGFDDLLAFWRGNLDHSQLSNLIHAYSLLQSHGGDSASRDAVQIRVDPTPDLQTGLVWFSPDGQPRTRLEPIEWQGRKLLSNPEFEAALELPRIYHVLKLCFVGGRLPRRPAEGQTVQRSGDEPFPPACLDVLSLLEAARVSEAVRTAARRLAAKGYPTLLRDSDLDGLSLDADRCRRLAAMLLIPVRHAGVSAGLAVKPLGISS
ncbi:MAG: type I-U CRISPR-associated protein Csx17 [Bryobacterales bacterium]|nr:type I-U CRISPR-associated protein Csx17 [Bryobacterales bacterium]